MLEIMTDKVFYREGLIQCSACKVMINIDKNDLDYFTSKKIEADSWMVKIDLAINRRATNVLCNKCFYDNSAKIKEGTGKWYIRKKIVKNNRNTRK